LKSSLSKKNEAIYGILYITVVADDCWMKRSLSDYDSLSGMNAIISYRTGKILFGIFNKYCTVRDIERNDCEPRAHKCYKNFDRNASSISMESDAIAEDFNVSLKMHELIYKTVIADGDSV